METGENLSETGEALLAKPTRQKSRKRSLLIFTLVSLLNIGLLALLWTQLLTPAHQSLSATQNQGLPTGNDPLIGQAAPNFTLAALNGQSKQIVSLANFKGQPVVINFWSSTCAPCNDEAPLLETQWQRTKTQGVVFLGIDLEDTNNDGLHFLQQHGVTYLSVIDADGSTEVNYGVTYTPETIFINRQGKIAVAIRQEITSQQLQSGLQTIMH
jgi:cytochrome c biogenesis protein CcmG/thiol:disulfide interchange protein DsbE